MGDQQLSPSSIDLGRNVSIYSTDQQPTTDGENDDEGRRLPVVTAAARASPPPLASEASAAGSSSLPSSSAVTGQSPVEPSVYCLGQQLDEQLQQQQQSSSSLSSSLSLVSAATTSGTVDEANLNSVVFSLGLMQVGVDASCQGSTNVDGHQQLLSNSNHQNLYPAIYQLLAQSQLPVHKWPTTGIKQQNAVSSFCPATVQNSMLFGNQQPSHGWNSTCQTNLLSHSNDFNSLWGQNQQLRNANSLPSNTADAKLPLKSSFAKNFPHSFSLRTGKTVSEESADGIQVILLE